MENLFVLTVIKMVSLHCSTTAIFATMWATNFFLLYKLMWHVSTFEKLRYFLFSRLRDNFTFVNF